MTFEILFPLHHITSLATAVVFQWAFYTHHLLLQELQKMEMEFFIFLLTFVRFFGLGFFFGGGQFYLLNSSGSHFPYLLSACTASSLAQPPSILPWRIATTVKLASCGQFYPHRILQTAVWKNFLEHKLELDITALLTLQCFIIALKIKF